MLSFCACSAKNGSTDGAAAKETPSAVPLPSQTPTPVAGEVVLTYSQNYNGLRSEEARAVLEELAAGAGMVFSEFPGLQAGEVKENWKVVVLLDVPANLNELVASAPQTQFVAVSQSEQPAAPNLSIIWEKPENQSFIAGFVTLMIATDWRAGALFSDDAVLSPLQLDAFINGGHYICGRCTSTWMPVKAFPLVSSMPVSTDLTAWQSVVAEMKMNVIYVMYVAPEVATNELLYELAAGGLILVGGKAPPDEIRPVWAGTVDFDPMTSLKNIWEPLLEGNGGQVVDASIRFSDINPQYFSQGRGRQAQQAVKSLISGAVYPLTPPLE